MNLEVSYEFDTPKTKLSDQHSDSLFFWITFVASLKEHTNGVLKDKLLPDYVNIDSSARSNLEDGVDDFVYKLDEAKEYGIRGLILPSLDGHGEKSYIEIVDESVIVDCIRGRQYLADLLVKLEIVNYVAPIDTLIDFETNLEYPLHYKIVLES